MAKLNGIRPEAKAVFDKLDEGVQLLYCTKQCQMCGAHLTIRQLNRVIIQGVPPVCLKCYKKMNEQFDELAYLFNQLSLF